MSFDAYHRAREAAVVAMRDVFPANLTAVASEHGVSVKPLRTVYRHNRGQPSDVPFCIVGQARGDVSDDGATKTACSLVVIVVNASSNPDELDATIDAYLTATVRTFAGNEIDGIYFEVSAFDADQPAQVGMDSSLVQTCGVNVTARIIESH